MSRHRSHQRERIGFTLAELLVAATLLIAGLAIVTQGTVQTKRLMQDMRHYNLAVDELSNQMERLTAMASSEREKALSELQPSDAIRSILAGVSLNAEEFYDDDGNRIVMSIQWDRGGPSAPLTLVGWIVPNDSSALGSQVHQHGKSGLASNTKFYSPFSFVWVRGSGKRGSGGEGSNRLETMPPHPQPFSPEYRGEGSQRSVNFHFEYGGETVANISWIGGSL